MNRKLLALLLITTTIPVSSPAVYACNKVEVRQGMDMIKTFAEKKTSYIIRENIDLDGKRIEIGKGSTLVFRGGSLANGTVVGNETRIKAGNYEIFKRGYNRYRAFIKKGASNNSPPSVEKVYHNSIILEGSWSNKECGSRWTGLLNGSKEDAMLSIKNFVVLHSRGSIVKMPFFEAFGYDSTVFPGGYSIDFNNSIISYPDDLDNWVDVTIKIPADATASPMESGYGLVTLKSNTTIKNLTIDGKSTKRQNEPPRLGVSSVISIGGSQNVTLESINLINILGPGMTVQAGAKDITFKDCKFKNIGEHIIYSHQYKGFCHFEGCYFDTWDSERLSVQRNGLNYVYKHDPPVEEASFSFEEAYQYDLEFTNCSFNNPQRVNAQGRTLGGFVTGSCPVVIKIKGCIFSGVYPPVNPGGGSALSEKSGYNTKMIVRDCKGAPYIYPSKSNFNIETEFYRCKEIPFRTIYAKRYENCMLSIDCYEDNIENVSSSYQSEFLEPLRVIDCQLIDNGSETKINHPIIHRSVIFENCTFKGITNQKTPSLVSTDNNRIAYVVFQQCVIELPNYKLINGEMGVDNVIIRECEIKALDALFIATKTNSITTERNKVADVLF